MIDSSYHIELLLLILGFLIIAAAADRLAPLFQKIHLPLITGFLIIGILSGPYVLDLIRASAKTKLNFINDIALAFIAFAAGAELYLRELRNRLNSIKWNTFGQLVITFSFSAIAVYLLVDAIPFMQGMTTGTKISVALFSGTIFVARSPASAIAVINELRAKGPFTQTVMGVTVLKDFIVIILFTINFSIAQSLINGDQFRIGSLLLIVTELIISAGLGIGVGYLIAILLTLRTRAKMLNLAIILTGYLVYVFTNQVRSQAEEVIGIEMTLEPLLICIVASFYVTNYTRFRADFLRFIHDSGQYVYTAFFLLTGASMEIDTLLSVWSAALIFFFLRISTMVLGSYVGGYLAGDPLRHRHIGWMPYITQAGVALGLTTMVSSEFNEWGNAFSALIIAIIVLNQFIGPPLFKWSLHFVGEDRSRAKSKTDTINDAIIIGYENQSVTLARQLKENGWLVQIATFKEKESFQEPEDLKISYLREISHKQLKDLGAEKTEAIICMLSDDENYEICEIAYQKFGTRDLIVRLNDHKNQEKFISIGARVVDPAMALVNLMDHFVRSPQATSLILGLERGQDSRDIELLNPNLHGISLRDLRLPDDVIILSVKRGGQMIISHGYTRLRRNDIITMVGSTKSLEDTALKFER